MNRTNINIEETKYKVIFSMKYAMQLIKMGYKPIYTMPNPEEPQYTSWVFEATEDFLRDFYALKEAFRNGR
jgi:hypothetical protein